MNKKTLTISALLACFFLAVGFKENEAALALQKTTKQFHTDLNLTAVAIANMKAAIVRLDGSTASELAVQEAVTNARMAYKKSEFLIAYLDGFAVKKNINGAPLPSVDPAIPDVMVIEPCGLQVLDEMAFSEAPTDEKAAMLSRCDKLIQDFKDVAQHQSRLPLEHRHVMEAIRQQLVRTFTLGVTGFDTPGSVNAIPEAKAAFEGMYAAFRHYMPLLEQKDRGLAIVLDARMEHTLKYLTENDDFDSFDRLAFLMEHIEPQYQLFYEVHKSLSIEFAEEVDKTPRAVNYHAVSLFAPDFLNAGYYANLDRKHPLMEKRRELGLTLFFDPILSKNIDRSCASCHHPEKAFTDGLPKPLAAGGKHSLLRNSPTLVNCVFADQYFWDLRESRLDRQMLHVIKSEEEFDTNYPEIIAKLNQSSEYKQLFAAAYPEQPDYQVSTYSISDALSAYVASLTDFDSPFDQYVQGKTGVLDPAAHRGFNLFMGKAACGTCHFAPAFNGTVPPTYDESESEVLGITLTADTLNPSLDSDLGRYANGMPRSKAEFYKTSFKTVTVRNAELTSPYMHNGAFKTLEEVVDFYNRGGGAGLKLDVPYQTLPFDELKLTKAEQADLVAFMKALTGDMSKFKSPKHLPKVDNQPEWNNRKVGGKDYQG
ncbi:MAG: cytochrome-c peroxidase [Saprospiraceae bacterium]|nr:cytochrome-c peroxidase [Saprospiraceae bacterium]